MSISMGGVIMFYWIEDLKETNEICYKGRSYKVIATRIRSDCRVDLLEDNISVIGENTSNNTFLDFVNINDAVNKQILEWAKTIIEKHYNICDRCKESKLVFLLSDYYKSKQFEGYKEICKKCRIEIHNEICIENRKKYERKADKVRKSLEKNPPTIVGGFKERIDAYKFLREMPEDSIQKIDKDFIYAKAILKANDGSYYPVFCVIDVSSGGELWDSLFIPVKVEEKLISQEFIFPYIGKTPEDIFPYSYETLTAISEDFHQDSFFGDITYENARHHLTNLIKVKRSNDYEKIVNISFRTYFSIQHLLSVALLIKQIRGVEKKLTKKYKEDDIFVYRTFCTNAVFSSVSFLEAAINEVFMDSYDNRDGIVRDVSDDIVNELAQMWALGIPRTANYSIIEKYQIALVLAKKEKMDTGLQPVQDINVLIKLRNALIHFEPEWVITQSTESSDSIQKLEKLLRNKFTLNAYTGENNPYFPDKCLSLGCVEWALKSIVCFCDNFFIKMGIIPPYEKIRHKINAVTDFSLSI